MAVIADYYDIDDLHPIDIVEHIAAGQDWVFDRLADDHITMEIVGQWRTYSITLAWAEQDETLRLICSFEITPPQHRLDHLKLALNAINDNCWAGAFTFWDDKNLMLYRYGLILAGGQSASVEQIDTMIGAAVRASEKYYPALQLVTWGEREIDDALQVAIAEAYGRA